MKKYIAILLVALLSLTILSGCSINKPVENAATAHNTNKTENNTGASSDNAATNTAEKITTDEAIEIALEHAGFAKADVTGLHSEYDYDDGIHKYDVDFRQGMYEYEYEINAESGTIISYDKDYDD